VALLVPGGIKNMNSARDVDQKKQKMSRLRSPPGFAEFETER